MSSRGLRAYQRRSLNSFVYLLKIFLHIPRLHISLLSTALLFEWRWLRRANRLFDSCLLPPASCLLPPCLLSSLPGSRFLVINSRKHPICPPFTLPFIRQCSSLQTVCASAKRVGISCVFREDERTPDVSVTLELKVKLFFCPSPLAACTVYLLEKINKSNPACALQPHLYFLTYFLFHFDLNICISPLGSSWVKINSQVEPAFSLPSFSVHIIWGETRLQLLVGC